MKVANLYKLFLSSGGISIDSRSIERGQIFFAVKGERFDGNQYAGRALEAGAKLAVVDDNSLVTNARVLVVPDALKMLQELARYHRGFFQGAVIGITGSNGKTTSKELTHAILSTQYYTAATKGNLNNHIGTPLTLLSMPVDLDFAVIEFGDNRPREIDLLSNIALPDFGVVTNVGKDHLEGFGNWQGVYNARKELFDHLEAHQKTAFVNMDLPYLREMAGGIAKVITYGTDDQVRYQYELESSDPFVKMKLWHNHQSLDIHSRLFGRYNFENLMLAATIGQYFEVPLPLIKAAIAAYEPGNNRSQIIEWKGNNILMDAYNANPSNVEAALESFAELKADRKMVILGDMLELGAHAGEEHERIAALALSKDFKQVVLVGAHFRPVAHAKGLLHFDDAGSLKRWAMEHLPKGYWILVKGSRKISLETLID